MVDFNNFSLQSQLPPGGPIQAPAPMQPQASASQQPMPFGLLGALLAPKANKKQPQINASSVGDRPVASIDRRPEQMQQLVSMFNTTAPAPPPPEPAPQAQQLPFPLSLFALLGGR